MTTRKQLAIKLIKKCEGKELKAYLDSVKVPTIGYGTIKYPNGVAVKMGDTCTIEQADEYLNDYLEKNVFKQVEKLCGSGVPDGVYAALCSLVYNCGAALQGQLIINAVKQKDWTLLASAFRRYIYANKEVVKGLVNRREIEIKHFSTSVQTNA